MPADNRTVKQMVDEYWPLYKAEAEQAKELFNSYCDHPMPRVPGMDTVLRLAIRIGLGKTVEEAAASEYAYRWKLASDRWRAFGAPHALGM